jgi:hypothetical protein
MGGFAGYENVARGDDRTEGDSNHGGVGKKLLLEILSRFEQRAETRFTRKVVSFLGERDSTATL